MARWQTPKLHRYLQREAWEFYAGWRHQFLYRNGELGENPSGAQCVNVPNKFYERLGVGAIGGNALDWVGFEDGYRVFRAYKNSLRLKVGDAALFRQSSSGEFGHVDLVLVGSANPYLGLDQNWPPGSPVSLVQHSRADLLGVVRLVRVPAYLE